LGRRQEFSLMPFISSYAGEAEGGNTARGWHPKLVKRIVQRLEQQVLMWRSLTHAQ